MAVQIGPKIGIEGEKEYRSQLKQIINETKNLESAMAKTASEWTENTSAMTRARAVAQNLAQQISKQEQELVILNQMLEESANKFGENASATLSWQRSVDYATASLNQMKTELANLNGAENFSEISTQFADVGQKVENMGNKLMMVGGVMTATITAPLVAAGKSAMGLASDMAEASSKVDVIFGSMSDSVKSFTDTSIEEFGISNVKAMEMIGTFGAMATQMGFSDKAAAEMATTLTGLSGDLAAFHNSEIEVTESALEGIFTGQTRALTQFAGAINEANLEEFAKSQGKVYSQMSEAEKVMTRYQLVLERTRDAQGNFKQTGDGTAGSIQKFKAAVQELGVAFGEELLPLITPLIQKLTSAIQVFSSLPGPIKAVITVIGLIVAAIGPVILYIGMMMSAMGSIITNAPVIMAAFAKIGTAVEALAADFTLLDSAAAPWLVLAAAVVASGVLIYSNWDKIAAAASDMAANVSAAYSRLVEGSEIVRGQISEFVQNIVQEFKELPRRIYQALKDAINSVKEAFDDMISNAKQSGKDFIQGFVDGIKEKVQKIVDAVKDIANTIKEYLGFSCPDKGPLHEYETWMPDFMQGLAKGIYQNKDIVTRAMNSLSKDMAIPLSANASMNMAIAGAGADGGSIGMFGGMTTNVYVDHINDLEDLIRIQNQAQQRYRMGAR